jgi:hypothetical protein
MTERRLDVLIAGTGLLYGSSGPRKKAICGIGYLGIRIIPDQADVAPQMAECLSSAAVLRYGRIIGERLCCKQLRKSDAFNSS